MQKVAIVSAVRTPIGSIGGALKNVQPEELLRIVIKAALERASVQGDVLDEVIMGQTKQSTDAPNIARVAALMADIPEVVPAYTVHRQCASGMQAILNGAQQIQTGYSDVVLVGGVESMSTAPFYLRNARFGVGTGNQLLLDPNTESQPKSQPEDKYGTFTMITTADNVAKKYQVSREDQDAFALESQRRAIAAIDAGRFADEIVEVRIPQRKKDDLVFDTDEYPKRDTDLDKLAKLRPIFPDGTVTAGNASGRNDGAAALLLMSAEAVAKYGATPLAWLTGAAATGVDPRYMGIAPWPASEKLLGRLGLGISDFDLFEINEAFAAQALASARGLGIDLDKLNVNGGGIALGHPLGASGARIIATLIHEMRRRDVQRGLASICVAGGLGMAMSVENAQG